MTGAFKAAHPAGEHFDGGTRHDDCCDSTPLPSALERASAEAAFIASALSRIEVEIGRTLCQADGGGLDKLQEVDAIRQAIEGLAQFLAALAVRVDPSVTCASGEAATGLGMRAQARRLLVSPDGAAQAVIEPPELWTD